MDRMMTASNRRLPSALLTALAVGGIACVARAGTITVCPGGSCDFTDPVAAVDAAVPGDTVLIAAGTYQLASTVQLYGKELTIRGAVDAQGRPTTVLDGQGTNNVLEALGVTDQTRFENLVITNGRADYGGGVFLSGANPVFRNCHLRNNSARWHGGAMLLSQSSSPTLIDCEITANSAGNTQFPGQGRAGAVTVGTGTLTLIGCTVSGTRRMDLAERSCCSPRAPCTSSRRASAATPPRPTRRSPSMLEAAPSPKGPMPASLTHAMTVPWCPPASLTSPRMASLTASTWARSSLRGAIA